MENLVYGKMRPPKPPNLIKKLSYPRVTPIDHYFSFCDTSRRVNPSVHRFLFSSVKY